MEQRSSGVEGMLVQLSGGSSEEWWPIQLWLCEEAFSIIPYSYSTLPQHHFPNDMMDLLSFSYIPFALSTTSSLIRIKRAHTHSSTYTRQTYAPQLYAARHRSCFLIIFIGQIVSSILLNTAFLAFAIQTHQTLLLFSSLLLTSMVRQVRTIESVVYVLLTWCRRFGKLTSGIRINMLITRCSSLLTS